ncbi:MAG: transposase [Candidatus Methanomethylicaceae archaeon]
MLKMVCLQFLYNLSNRAVEEEVTSNVLNKRFLWFSGSERPEDHITVCRLRARLGAEDIKTLFNWMVADARAGVWYRMSSTSWTPPTSPPRWTYFA